MLNKTDNIDLDKFVLSRIKTTLKKYESGISLIEIISRVKCEKGKM
jgi:hypothetical protein